MNKIRNKTIGASVVILCCLFLSRGHVFGQSEANTPQPGDLFDIRRLVGYQAESFRDPFESYLLEKKKESSRPANNEPETPLPALDLQGTVWGGAIGQAIVNGKVLKVGDSIDGVTLLEVDKKGITVLFNNRKHTVSSPAISGSAANTTGK